jgi:Tol biopolymer transport system component
VSERGGKPGLYVIDPATSVAHAIARMGSDGCRPSWSPDRRRIAYSDSSGLRVLTVRGLRRERLPSGGGCPTWSLDGRWIAFEIADAGIGVVDVRTRTSRIVFPPRKDLGGGFIEPAWAPDNGLTAWNICCEPPALAIRYLPRQRSTRLRTVLESGLYLGDGSLDWSPDGKWLAVTSGKYGHARGRTPPRLWLPRVLAASVIWKTPVPHKDPNDGAILTRGYDPSWSPDGEWIAFVSNRDGDPEIYVMHSDGSGIRQLTHNNWPDYAPDW